jgi:hypothetical protein
MVLFKNQYARAKVLEAFFADRTEPAAPEAAVTAWLTTCDGCELIAATFEALKRLMSCLLVD